MTRKVAVAQPTFSWHAPCCDARQAKPTVMRRMHLDSQAVLPADKLTSKVQGCALLVSAFCFVFLLVRLGIPAVGVP